MNDKKNILLHLYSDPDAEGDLRSLLKDEDLRREHQALSEARFNLEFIPRQLPDPKTVNAIISEARRAADMATPGRRPDRPPIWRSRSLRRVLIPTLSIAAVIVISVGLGLFSSNTFKDRVLDTAIFEADAVITPAESLLRPTPVPPSLAAQIASFDFDPELAWDDARDIRQLYRRIESLRPTDELDWDERAMPLELIPTNANANQNLRRASIPRR